MKLNEIISKLNKRIPQGWAEAWDNPGIAVGSYCSEINKIAVALDATVANITSAKEHNCELLIVHHPLIFRPIRNVTDDNHTGAAIYAAIKSEINIFAAHTNWDWSPEGVNYSLAKLLGLSDIKPILPLTNGAWGIGAYGVFNETLTLEDVSKFILKRWNLSNSTFYGEKNTIIKKIALGGGACMDFWRDAKALGADCFITSDITYHHCQEALEQGLTLISLDHGEMERASLNSLCNAIKEETHLSVILLEEKEHFCGHTVNN